MDATAGFDDAVFGHGLPEQARLCIIDAGLVRSAEPGLALALLNRARELAPEHPATLIALYRFHFYGHRLGVARELAAEAMQLGARTLGLPQCWTAVPHQALTGARFDATTRFYLFALKGYAYLSMRLGEFEHATQALALLRALDPDNRVGGRLLEEVLSRATRGDELDEDGEDNVPTLLPLVSA